MEKDCPSCGAKKIMVESLDGGYRLVCQSCGFSQIYNDGGKKLLTDERSQPLSPQRLLVD